MRIKCTVSYDGSGFSGYQRQPGLRTVQGEIEEALMKIHKGERIKITASGRTDVGVHAVGQVFHFDTSLKIPMEKWPIALNTLLPQDISIQNAELADQDFHARFSAKKKEYRYRLYRSFQRDVFRRHYAYHFPNPLNIETIRTASRFIIGTHDFTSFCSSKTETENKVRTIYEADIWEEGDEITFRFVGSGFLYNMVRILVGTLIEVGEGKRKPEEIKQIIAAKDRSRAGKTVSGCGLYLWKVYYDN
ncbi:MAG: tRNA pseudouridine(38-40) synthase TruA [Bacillaceae bacterium]|jgi:pseudouridylate synthase I|uniref:tRNA pseudouridine synthase A n=1 Tax=Aeribacillus pallidus TaxID=33936 RepID=A0A165YCD3_9BACI|nr:MULTISPECIES: tRNA pseudouridine(38-40) synthase TruA [Aeribacillus]REJ14133.1 MAG: tRNA pseudouridine(38-40) synthase TruA [Bacillaceae bacterium]KZN96932.1 tRNA pseudouridine(38,39,40) synthase TruA [Aeribacillus pallidus]MED0714176.1 tRNA pseudouridine(38-40) synthase TruA [Aeribacillus composti]MED0744483.1 tRNA pseudouridine(38-40) synthase TruA [Aeribacillus composti]REJ21654.1 MAG: tRNA pseudouridine(38-40) synthase TruA [Bacillaceae bacterium]